MKGRIRTIESVGIQGGQLVLLLGRCLHLRRNEGKKQYNHAEDGSKERKRRKGSLGGHHRGL